MNFRVEIPLLGGGAVTKAKSILRLELLKPWDYELQVGCRDEARGGGMPRWGEKVESERVIDLKGEPGDHLTHAPRSGLFNIILLTRGRR